MKKFLYGPVPSRRLGRSLGIDVVAYKTCTYDCIYCHLGRTTNKTLERKEYASFSSIADELKHNRDMLDSADYITIAGSGEPTLYSRLGDLIACIKENTRTPLAVITNSSLLWDRTVQRELKNADVVIPSLDAGDAVLFDHINRPLHDISFERMVGGLVEFRRIFKNKLWLEVLLVGGFTAVVSEVEKIAERIREIRPDKVQVNTVVRPPPEAFAYTVSPAHLKNMACLLGNNAEVIAEFSSGGSAQPLSGSYEDILTMLQRRPCTIEDIVAGIGLNWNVVVKQMAQLVKTNAVSTHSMHGSTFFVARKDTGKVSGA